MMLLRTGAPTRYVVPRGVFRGARYAVKIVAAT